MSTVIIGGGGGHADVRPEAYILIRPDLSEAVGPFGSVEDAQAYAATHTAKIWRMMPLSAP